MKNIFLHGLPGIGKTTILQKVINSVGKEHFGGFYTEEILDKCGIRKGFKIITLDGNQGIMAHVNSPSKQRISDYGVETSFLESEAIPSIANSIKTKQYTAIDEIGPMQLDFSPNFKTVVLEALESGQWVLGTVVHRSYEWADDFKKRDDVRLIEVTEDNRDAVPDEIIRIITGS